jgi:hypothetical protein
MNFKKRVPRSEKYKKYVASQPCLVCGGKSVAHHENPIGHGSVALKCGDDRVLCLCVAHHQDRHQQGRSVWVKWHIDTEFEMWKLKKEWLSENNLPFW